MSTERVVCRAGGDVRALVLSIGGIALIMPTLGVETHIPPVIGGLYLALAFGVQCVWVINSPTRRHTTAKGRQENSRP